MNAGNGNSADSGPKGPPRLPARVVELSWGLHDRSVRALVFHSERDRRDLEAMDDGNRPALPDCPRPVNPSENPFPGYVLVDQRTRAEARRDARKGLTLAVRAHRVIQTVEEVGAILGDDAPPEAEWRPRAPAYPLRIGRA